MAGLKIKAKAHTSWHRCSRSSGASWKSWRGTAETNPSPNQWDWCPFSQPLRHLNISQYFLFSDVVPLQVDTLPMEAEHTMPSPTVPVGDSEAWQPRFRVQYWSGNSHHVNQYFFYACICTYTCIYTCIYMIIYGDDNYDELLIEICVHVVYTWQYLRTWYSNSTMCIIKPIFLCMHLHVYMCVYIYICIYTYIYIWSYMVMIIMMNFSHRVMYVIYTWRYLRTWYSNSTICIIISLCICTCPWGAICRDHCNHAGDADPEACHKEEGNEKGQEGKEGEENRKD